jgi:Ca2+-binding EF-hand superfamily protein
MAKDCELRRRKGHLEPGMFLHPPCGAPGNEDLLRPQLPLPLRSTRAVEPPKLITSFPGRVALRQRDRRGHPMDMSEGPLQRYDASFAALDVNSTGKITREQVVPLFERAALQPDTVDRLWRAADVERSGRLDRAAFRKLMHFATLTMQGKAFPEAGLSASSASATDSGPWAGGVSAEDAKRYDSYFVLLDATSAGAVTRAQAAPLFQRAALPEGDVQHLWSLSDLDGDGKLSKSEFRVAMHMATCARSHAQAPSWLLPVPAGGMPPCTHSRPGHLGMRAHTRRTPTTRSRPSFLPLPTPRPPSRSLTVAPPLLSPRRG